MGGDKYGNGGIIDVNNDWASAINLGAKAIGFAFGGPQGANMASMGSNALFGNDSEGKSGLGKANKFADTAMTASSFGQNPAKMSSSELPKGAGIEMGGSYGKMDGIDLGKKFSENPINQAVIQSQPYSNDTFGNMRRGFDFMKTIGEAVQRNPEAQMQMLNPAMIDGVQPQNHMLGSPSMGNVNPVQLRNPYGNRMGTRSPQYGSR